MSWHYGNTLVSDSEMSYRLSMLDPSLAGPAKALEERANIAGSPFQRLPNSYMYEAASSYVMGAVAAGVFKGARAAWRAPSGVVSRTGAGLRGAMVEGIYILQ
ncbi:hypothetical protein KIPB_014362 [Kipferlia bialata]|uniref:Uncharacterized protein n=1 Tax=Kipferlia bialata TaxID=797122 RepID=A0A9K3GQ38_9EUKA|nr:hypothetical protein KIPB_014362 [Kipferlia bialata]|eukprot:g14362.t1